MGDMGDHWNDVKNFMKEESRKKKERNKIMSTNNLISNKVRFESKNNGNHLVVENTYDFWPSTGVFINRKTKKKSRGVRELLNLVGSS